MLADEVHEGQAMVGIVGGPTILTQREPAEPPLVVLGELAVGLRALLFREPKRVPLADHLTDEIVVVGFRPVGPLAVGPEIGLHLHDAHVDAHLQHLAPRPGLDQSGVDLAGVKLPIAE